MEKKFLFNYLTLLIISVPLFLYYFVIEVQTPNYFLCNELIDYSINLFSYSFDIIYPRSCDQPLYERGFYDLKQIFAEDFNYQDRPLYISIVSVVNTVLVTILNIFNVELNSIIYISNFLVQIGIATYCLSLFKKIYFGDSKISILDSIVVSLILLLSPLFKWGVFDPSHQLLTLVAILFSINFVKSEKTIGTKEALLFGILYMLHRTFLITFIWVLLFKTYKRKENVYDSLKNLIKNFKYYYFIISLLPTLSYNGYIRFVLDNKVYDANTQYWGQFVWIFDFIRGKVNYESEWHCVTVPANFICYFEDNLKLFFYLLIPLAFVLYFFYKTKIKFTDNQKLTLSICLFLYLFWSFIGWYPPIRFSYYSLGHLIIILFMYYTITYKHQPGKFLILSSYLLFAITLNHWNSPKLIEFNFLIYTSILLFLAFLIYDKNSKSYS